MLNDTFGNNVGTYFSAISCFTGFLTLFSIDIHHRLNRKHIDNYLRQTQNSKLWTIKNNETASKLLRPKDESNAIYSNLQNSLLNPAKSLNATLRLLGNRSNRLFYSQNAQNANANNDEMMRKFLNSRQEQHPNKHQRIDRSKQIAQQRNNSLPQLSLDDFQNKEEDNILPFVLSPNLQFASSYATNHLLGSRHSLDTLLSKTAAVNFNNQLVNFSSLPEFTNLLSNLKCSNNFTNLPVKSFLNPAHRPTATTKKKVLNYFDNNKTTSNDKMIYLNSSSKQHATREGNESNERRNSGISIRKLSQQINLIENGDELAHLSQHSNKSNYKDSSSESLSDADSDLEEINVDCNQIKNDKQVLEDLNELINESLNNDNFNNLDKLFLRCSPSTSDEENGGGEMNGNFKNDFKGECSKQDNHKQVSKQNQHQNDSIDFQSSTKEQAKQSKLDSIKKLKTKLDLDNDNLFSGQLICNDYEHLVKSLLHSKQKEKHQDNCVMSRLIQEILKQITIKSLSDEFNQTTPSDSPNRDLIQLQADLNRFDQEFTKRYDKFNDKNYEKQFDRQYDRHCDRQLDYPFNSFDPSNSRFIKDNLSSKCVNCDKLID